jgi:1-acyl-sn-glycerol-3-phosphate acyltransferase
VHALCRRARWVAVAVTVGGYTVLSPFGYLFFTALFLTGAHDPVRRARRTQRVMAGAYRFMHDWMRWTGITRFDHRGALRGMPQGPCVVIANHPTLMDVTAIGAVLGGGCTIAKPALFRRRGLRPLLEGARNLEGPGDDPAAMTRVVDEAVARLAEGFSIIIFPEGTRSPPGRLLRFGRAAFEIACRARVPVVSVGIRCEPMWLSKEVPLFDPPHPVPDLSLLLLAIDDPAHVNYESRLLRRTVEARYRAWFAGGRHPQRAAASGPAAAKDGSLPCPTDSPTA